MIHAVYVSTPSNQHMFSAVIPHILLLWHLAINATGLLLVSRNSVLLFFYADRGFPVAEGRSCAHGANSLTAPLATALCEMVSSHGEALVRIVRTCTDLEMSIGFAEPSRLNVNSPAFLLGSVCLHVSEWEAAVDRVAWSCLPT